MTTENAKTKIGLLSFPGNVTVEMVTRWGMVAAEPDGVDDAGRQKLRILTPYELVDRALQTAEILNEELLYRRWMTMEADTENADAEKENGA